MLKLGLMQGAFFKLVALSDGRQLLSQPQCVCFLRHSCAEVEQVDLLQC